MLSITHTTGASSEKVLYFANELFKMIQEIEYHSSSNDTQRLIQELKQEISLTPSLASEIKKELQNIYFRLNLHAKFLINIGLYAAVKVHHILARSAAIIDDHQRL